MVGYKVSLILSLVLVMAVQRLLNSTETCARTDPLTTERQARLGIVKEARKRIGPVNRHSGLMHPSGLFSSRVGLSLYVVVSRFNEPDRIDSGVIAPDLVIQLAAAFDRTRIAEVAQASTSCGNLEGQTGRAWFLEEANRARLVRGVGQ